jgi:hypothetical protein
MKGSFSVTVFLRSGGEVVGESKDVSGESESDIEFGIEALAEMFKSIKKLEFLSLDVGDDGTEIIHPDDISRIRINGTTPELRELIQRVT